MEPNGVNGYVFISYSRRDTPFVKRLQADLKSRGIDYWIDRDGIRPGNANWERSIRDAIRSARAMIFVASPNFHGSDVIHGELGLAKSLGRVIYPIWAEGASWEDCVPIRMISAQYVDMRGGYYETGLVDLLAALGGDVEQVNLGYVEAPPAAPPVDMPTRNPYKGLRAFTEADTGDYFGRGKLVNTLAEMVSIRSAEDDNRLIAVIGPSGSGKSSVVMAGLLPKLKSGALPGSDRWIYLPPLLPEGDPIMGLMFALKAALPPSRRQEELRQELMAEDGLGLHRLATQLRRNPDDRVVVFIDQFEEVFTLVEDETLRNQFIHLLSMAATEPDSPVLVLLTLRADFYDRPMNYPLLGKLIESNNKSVLPMTLAELLEAISEPASLPDVRLMFEGELVVEIAFDLLDSREPGNKGTSLAGALPLLQFTLERLYLEREAHRLTTEAYTRMGGVMGAIGKHAEEVFATLDEAAQKTFPRVFYRLVNIDEHGTPTRRRSERTEATAGDAAAENLVTALVENRLLIADTGDVIEVAHEALLRSWERLARWIDATAEDIYWLQKVQAAAQEWDRMGRLDRQLWDYEDLYPVYAAIERLEVRLEPLVREFIHPQMDRLLDEFKTAPEYRQLSIVDRFDEIGEDAASALVVALAFAKGDEVRDRIDATLWKMPDAASRELIAVLGKKETNLRRAAADAVARLGIARAILALISNLRDASLNQKLPELKALAALADPAAIPALIASLKAERWEERRTAAEALGAIGVQDDIAVGALMKLLNDTRMEVRQAALISLGQIGTPKNAKQLIDKMRDNTLTPTDRQALVGALGRLSEVRTPVPLEEASRNRLKMMLMEASSAPEDEVRQAVAEAFGKLKDPTVIAQLSFMLRDTNAQVRETVAQTMGILGHSHGIRPLLDTLADKSPLVRCAAIRALQTFSDRGHVRQNLRRILFNDTDSRVRAEAASVLAAAGDSNSTDALMRRLKDKMVIVQHAVIEALGVLKAPGATDPLLNIVRTKKIWHLRYAAARSLGKIGITRARDGLIALSSEKDADAAFVSSVALTAFDYQDEATLKCLAEGLADPRPEVRAAAAEALGVLQHHPALSALMALLHDQDGEVRRAAAHALAEIGDTSVVKDLQALHDHPFQGVRQAAQIVLTTLEKLPAPVSPPREDQSAPSPNGAPAPQMDARDKTLPLRDMLPKTLIPPRPSVLSPSPSQSTSSAPDKPVSPE